MTPGRDPPHRAEIMPVTGIKPQVARFMRPTWGPTGADSTQVGPTLASWTLLSGAIINYVRALQADDYEVIFGANASRFILYFDSSEYISDPYMVDMLWTVTNPKLKCIISSTTIGICWRNVELQQIVKTLPQLPHIYVSESGQKWFR